MIRIHPTADVSDQAQIGDGTAIWHQVQVRERSRIGQNCILGKGVYVDFDVQIGDRCKLQNGASIYHGVTLEDGVFVGPGAILTNDRFPRAINPDGSLKTDADWEVGRIHVKRGASLGAGSVILPGITVGEFALVGAGAVVTRSVPDHGLVAGNPAHLLGYVCRCGRRLAPDEPDEAKELFHCDTCGEVYRLPPGQETQIPSFPGTETEGRR
jgi:acetyltransferase-like isoleucine patch superfamily enzyme